MRYKKIKQTAFALGFLTLLNNSAQSALSIDESGNVEIAGTLKVQGSFYAGVPIGTVLDWWKPSGSNAPVPDGFAICDGSSRFPATALAPWTNVVVPNLSGLFILGTSDPMRIGGGGGQPTVPGVVPSTSSAGGGAITYHGQGVELARTGVISRSQTVPDGTPDPTKELLNKPYMLISAGYGGAWTNKSNLANGQGPQPFCAAGYDSEHMHFLPKIEDIQNHTHDIKNYMQLLKIIRIK